MKTEPQFRIYKEGVTDGIITIVSEVGKPFNKEAKIKFYQSLGYIVYSL